MYCRKTFGMIFCRLAANFWAGRTCQLAASLLGFQRRKNGCTYSQNFVGFGGGFGWKLHRLLRSKERQTSRIICHFADKTIFAHGRDTSEPKG